MVAVGRCVGGYGRSVVAMGLWLRYDCGCGRSVCRCVGGCGMTVVAVGRCVGVSVVVVGRWLR